MWTCPDLHARLTVTPGFLLLMAGLLYLDEGAGLLPWALLACAVHELGHLAACAAHGGRVERLTLSAVGAELRFSYRHALSYSGENLVLLAGPAANLLLAVPAYLSGFRVLAVFSVWIGAFNLLPIPPLHGGALADNLLAERWGDGPAPQAVLTAVSGILAGLLAGVGAIAAAVYGNVTLLLTAFWLLWGIVRPGRRGRMH